VACAGGGAEGHGLVGEGACVFMCVYVCVCMLHYGGACMGGVYASKGAGGLGLVVKIDVTVAVEVGWKWSVCVWGGVWVCQGDVQASM